MSLQRIEKPLIIPGNPTTKARPRVVWSEKLGRQVTFTPKNTAEWETKARFLARGWWRPRVMLQEGPVAIRADFIYARPKDFKGPKGRSWCPKGGSYYPDIDNTMKAVLDALQARFKQVNRVRTMTEWGVYADDYQVVLMQEHKMFAAEGEDPCVEVDIWVPDDEIQARPEQQRLFK